MRTKRLSGAAAVFAGLVAAGCQDLPTQNLPTEPFPASRSIARDPSSLTKPSAKQLGCAVVYKVVINGREKRRFGKLHARFPQAKDGSTARHKVLIKDAKSHEVVLTAECTLPNTQEAVAGLYRAFKLAEPVRSPATPSASKSTRKLGPATGPRFSTDPVLLPGLTVVGYRESGYHENWAVDNYGWGSHGDSYTGGGSAEAGQEPDWWYETDEGNDELLTYCHSVGCPVHEPDAIEREKLRQEIGKMRTEGIFGQAKALAQGFLDSTPSQIKLWNGEVRDSLGYIVVGDYRRKILPDPAEIHLSVDYGMTAAMIAHEAMHALGKAHGYTETFPDGVTRTFGARTSTDTMGNYCG